MKVISIIKKNKLLFIVALAYIVIFIAAPDKAVKSLNNSTYYLIEMLQVLPVIFLLTAVVEALIPKEVIMRSFGENSGFKGNLFALLLGSISAGPIYAAFPLCKTLLKKGASISNIVIILSAWAVIKVPMLANEAKFLGVNFMALRWVLTVIAIFIMAYVMSLVVKKEDMPKDLESAAKLKVKEEYCIGCELCVKLLPQYYEMRENKAIAVKAPEDGKDMQAIKESVQKCPSNAISFMQE